MKFGSRPHEFHIFQVESGDARRTTIATESFEVALREMLDVSKAKGPLEMHSLSDLARQASQRMDDYVLVESGSPVPLDVETGSLAYRAGLEPSSKEHESNFRRKIVPSTDHAAAVALAELNRRLRGRRNPLAGDSEPSSSTPTATG